ncbi:MAG: DNA cytosine methyltransferase [DPANN group archaeon]|nr:DNA cytosine methyltransferase [DPANN group archaeon]
MLKELNFIDLFAGIGGFRIALEKHGANCVFSSEWDKYAQITYKENFGDIPQGDITKIKETDIPKHDILCGGFPCQAFSISGKQRGFKDTRGTLFFDIARIVEHHQPKVLFLENVKNLTKHYHGNTLKIILRTLEELGYNVFYEVLKASYYDVPQARERIYIVCFRKDLEITNFNFPKPTNKQIYVKDILENDENTKDCIVNRTDVKFWKRDETPSLNPIQIGQINNGGQGERIYSINGHAITLSAYGGGVAGKTGAYLVNEKIRRLTPRECARVQGFPEWFKIPVSKSQAYKQFGNSVSVPVIDAIFEQITNILNKENEILT